MKQTILFTK